MSLTAQSLQMCLVFLIFKLISDAAWIMCMIKMLLVMVLLAMTSCSHNSQQMTHFHLYQMFGLLKKLYVCPSTVYLSVRISIFMQLNVLLESLIEAPCL